MSGVGAWIESVGDWKLLDIRFGGVGSWWWGCNLMRLLRRLEMMRGERGCLAVRGAVVY